MVTLYPLSLEERQAHDGATHAAQLLASDLTETALGQSQGFDLATLDAEVSVRGVYTHLSVPFEDSTDAAFNATTVLVGDTGDADRYVTSQQVNGNGTEVVMKRATATTKVYATADTLKLTVGAVADKALASLDRGELWLYVSIVDAR